MNDKATSLPGGAPVPAPPPEGPKSFLMDRLPRSFQHVLSWLPPQDYRLVETAVCHLPIMRDMVAVVRFADAVWTVARNAEHRTTDRITGTEMDRFRDRLDVAVQELMAVTVELAQRARLTEVQQRYKKILRRFGYLKDSSPDPESRPTPAAVA